MRALGITPRRIGSIVSNETDIEKLIDNEKEWRRAMWKKLEKIEDRMGSMRVQNGIFTTFLALIVGYIGSWLRSRL